MRLYNILTVVAPLLAAACATVPQQGSHSASAITEPGPVANPNLPPGVESVAFVLRDGSTAACSAVQDEGVHKITNPSGVIVSRYKVLEGGAYFFHYTDASNVAVDVLIQGDRVVGLGVDGKPGPVKDGSDARVIVEDFKTQRALCGTLMGIVINQRSAEHPMQPGTVIDPNNGGLIVRVVINGRTPTPPPNQAPTPGS